MPTTETQGATRAPDKWPPLTPVQVVAVPSWLARTFVALGLVLVLEIAAAAAWLRQEIADGAEWSRSAAQSLSQKGTTHANDIRQGDELQQQTK